MRNIKKLFIIFAIAAAGVVSAAGQGTAERDRGIDLYQAGNFSEAAELLAKFAKTDKKDKPACIYLGASYVKLGDGKAAVAAFERCSKLSSEQPHNPPELYDPAMKIIRKPKSNYTELARTRGTEGQVHLAVELSADGKIGFVLPIRTLPNGLTEASIAAARQIEFEPARRNGNPVPVVQIMVYSFHIY